MSTNVIFLNVEEVIAINVAMITQYSQGEQIGIKDQNLLESAVYRPQQSVLGQDAYVTIFDKAAALFLSLAQNHPFQNANKRTAFTALVIFLYYNQYSFSMDAKQAEDFTVDAVNHRYTFQEIAAIIQECSHQL